MYNLKSCVYKLRYFSVLSVVCLAFTLHFLILLVKSNYICRTLPITSLSSGSAPGGFALVQPQAMTVAYRNVFIQHTA